MMRFGRIIFICVCILFANDNLTNAFPEVSISLQPEGTPYHSILSAIPGFKSCGGPAQVLDWRFEGCSSVGKTGLCLIPSHGKIYQDELTLIPSEPIPGGLGARFTISADDISPKTHEVIFPKSAITGGQVYTLRTTGSPPKELVGKIGTFRYEVFRQQDKFIEACVEGNFETL